MSSGCTPVKSGSRCQQDTHCVHTVSEPEVITEVPLTMTTMQAVQDSWMGLVTRQASGVWVLVIGHLILIP